MYSKTVSHLYCNTIAVAYSAIVVAYTFLTYDWMNNNTAIEYFFWAATDVLFVESWRQNILQNFAPLGSFFILFQFNFF